MIFVLGAVIVFAVMLVLHRPGTRACRWRADKTRDRGTMTAWRCAACGAEGFTGTGQPPKDCKRNLKGPGL